MINLNIYFIVFILALTSIGFSNESIKISYEDTVKLELESHPSKMGIDIWLSKNHKKTWVLIGKTFKSGGTFNYKIKSNDIHYFHFYARTGENDPYKPNPKTKADEKIKVAVLENQNLQILYSNKRLLSIDYEVQDATASIEGSTFRSWLYYTQNSGLNWTYYAEDTDGVSPMSFLAKKDGLYGYKIISADMIGQKARAPGPGDQPEILVRIDTIPPQIKIISPQPEDLWETGTTRQIRWTAKDDAMERLKSVTLYYSVGTRGPWVKINDKLSSSGEHPFIIPKSDNGLIYIMATAGDKSGNRGVVEMAKPFYTRNIREEMLDPNIRRQAEAYYETATICRKNRNFEKSIKYFRLCLQLNPFHVRAWNDLGNTFIKINEIKPAFNAYEKGLQYSPSNMNLLCNLGRLYTEYKQYEEADEVLSRVVFLYPSRPEGLWLKSELLADIGHIAEARVYWNRLSNLVFSESSMGHKLKKMAKKSLQRTSTVSGSYTSTKGINFNSGLE
jgi:Flp pilus assembly protein TadD